MNKLGSSRSLSMLLFFCSIFISFLHATSGVAYAQKTACVVTKVGNPSGNQPSCETNIAPVPVGDQPLPPNTPADLRTAIIDKFHVTMNGYDQDHLLWAWQQFWSASGTKFDTLISGATLQASGCGGDPDATWSCQAGCRNSSVSVYVKNYVLFSDPEQYFKFILTHELGHFVRNCNARADSYWDEHDAAQNKEGAISYYGGHARTCSGSDNYSEDYADFVAYFLNQNSGNTSNGINCGPYYPDNPYFKTMPMAVPLHLMVIKGILLGSPVNESQLQ